MASKRKKLNTDKEPMIMNEKPTCYSTVHDEPMIVHEEPSIVHDEPMIVNEEPSIVHDDPMIVQMELSTTFDNQEPSTSFANQGPSTTFNNQEPSTSFINQKLSTISQQTYCAGEFIWGKLGNMKWWPAITINPSDCGRSSSKCGYSWVFWFGDHKISELRWQRMVNFIPSFRDMNKIPSSKLRMKAITEVLKIFANMADKSFSKTSDLYKWADDGFPNFQLKKDASLFKLVTDCLDKYRKQMEELVVTQEPSSEDTGENFCEQLKSGILNIEEICISCYGSNKEVLSKHPFFIGSICDSCKELLIGTMFAIGDDGKNMCCIICGKPGFLIMCDKTDCPKSYCQKCIKCYLGDTVTKQIVNTLSWYCFFCSPNETNDSTLKIRKDWEERIVTAHSSFPVVLDDNLEKRPMNVLSLFDGISTGKLVLDMLGIVVNKYYASEINEDALIVSKMNHNNSITYIGNVCYITEREIESFDDIDLVLGGSPCNDLSLVNPVKKGIYNPKGTGSLFFDYYHILSIIRRKNKNVFFLFENVAAMTIKDKSIMSAFLRGKPAVIDAKYFSPQNRARNFWGNIPGLYRLQNLWNSLPDEALEKNVLSDCILPNLGREAVVQKVRTITTQRNSLVQGKDAIMPITMNGTPDVMWVTEIEQIFGFPRHYTDTGNLGITKRRELLGRSWSVPVIKTILQPLKSFFKCK